MLHYHVKEKLWSILLSEYFTSSSIQKTLFKQFAYPTFDNEQKANYWSFDESQSSERSLYGIWSAHTTALYHNHSGDTHHGETTNYVRHMPSKIIHSELSGGSYTKTIMNDVH